MSLFYQLNKQGTQERFYGWYYRQKGYNLSVHTGRPVMQIISETVVKRLLSHPSKLQDQPRKHYGFISSITDKRLLKNDFVGLISRA